MSEKRAPSAVHHGEDLEEATGIGVGLVSLWLVVLCLSFYGASHVLDEVSKSDLLADSWLRSQVEAIADVRAKLSFVGIPAASDALRQKINEPHLILQLGDEPAPDQTDPTTPDAGVIASADAGPADGSSPAAEALVHIAPKRKNRVIVIGASSIQFAVGVAFERTLPKYEGVRVKRFGQLATGLSRPDFFDWPKKLDKMSKRFKPDLVIANFGGNGAQDIPVPGAKKIKFGTERWDEIYEERVQELVDVANKHGADIVFLGMPIMRSEKFSRKMKHLNGVQERAARAAGALWFPTWAMAATKDGKYRKTLRYKGKRGLMRTSDGVHYRKIGATFVVDNALTFVERTYLLPPKDPKRAVAQPHAFVSKVSSSTVSYTAFVPKDVDAPPALYVDADESWATWPNYPHFEIQRLAQKHGVLVVVLESEVSEDVFAEEVRVDVETHLRVSEKWSRFSPGPSTKLSDAIKAAAED